MNEKTAIDPALETAETITRWYYANKPSSAVPDGFGDEEAIRSLWAAENPR